MKMKKDAAALLLIIVTVLTINGCQKENVPSDTSIQSQETETLRTENSRTAEVSTENSETEAIDATESVSETSGTEAGGLIAGSPWNDSNILGNLPEERPNPEDDFNASVNYDWLKAQTSVPDGYGKYGVREELEEENKQKLMALMTDETQTGHEAELLRQLYASVLDTDARNTAGIEPILPYIQSVMQIQNLEQLTNYLCSSEFQLTSPLFDSNIFRDFKNSGQNMLLILPSAEDTNSLEDKEHASDSIYSSVMERAGISPEEILALNLGADRLTEAIGNSATDVSSSPYLFEQLESYYHPYTLEELKNESPAYPLAGILEAKGYASVPCISIYSVNWLKEINALYTEENLQGFKGMLVHQIISEMASCLDEECMETADEIYIAENSHLPDSTMEGRAYSICNEYLSVPLGMLYIKNEFSDEVKKDVETMVEDIRNVLRERIKNTDWLTEATRTKAVEKLDAIKVRVGYGEKWKDYSGLNLLGSDAAGSLAGQIIAIKKFEEEQKAKQAVQAPDPNYWVIGPEYKVGAAYNAQDNSINIPAGILGGDFYHSEGSLEERYFAIGTIIGHELTHGFDFNGSHFDKDGNLAEWWTEEDRSAFKNQQKNVLDYFSSIEVKPDEYLNAESAIGEITADLAGLSLVLETAESKGDVDYQKAFRIYADLWPEVMTSDMASIYLNYDEHPPKYIRVNGIVQQFQQFHDAFNVREGDGMYLAPEKRVKIW